MYGLEAVEVGFRKLVAVSVRKVGGIRMLVAVVTGLIFAPKRMRVTVHHCHQAYYIFYFCGKATVATAKKQQSNMYGLEAVEVGFRKLVAVSVWKVGGIQMLVVARMPPLLWLG